MVQGNLKASNLDQMLVAYKRAEDTGLENLRLGTTGIFVRTEGGLQLLRGLL